MTAGPVILTDITVDGTGFYGVGCPVELVGIYYSSGSSGTVNEVTTRNHINYQCSIGILAENFSSTSESVTIQNSSVHDVDGVGILAVTDQTQPTLTATIKGNTVDVDGGDQGIQAVFNAGSVTGNVVSGGVEGLLLAAPASIASGNTITKSYIGIFADIDGVSATSNKISNSVIGIVTTANGTTFQSNTITVNLISKRQDLRFGIQNFEASDVVLGEPDAKVFQLPGDFKVIDPRRATTTSSSPAHSPD